MLKDEFIEKFIQDILDELKFTGDEILLNEKNGRRATSRWWARKQYDKLFCYFLQLDKRGVKTDGEMLFDWTITDFKKLRIIKSESTDSLASTSSGGEAIKIASEQMDSPRMRR